MSACPACRASSFDQVKGHPAHRPEVDVLREPRRIAGHGHRRVQIGLAEDPQRLGVLRLERVQQVCELLVVTHHVLVLVFGGPLLERPLVGCGHVGRGRHPLHPATLHSGRVLDQAADRQRAHRRGGARLIVGQAVGDREERVSGEAPGTRAARLAFVTDGWGSAGMLNSPSRWLLCVKVSDAGDFGTVVDHLAVDVQDQLAERMLGVRALGRPARPVQLIVVEARGHPRSISRRRRRAGAARSPRRWRTASSGSRRAARRSASGCASPARRR